MRKKRNPSTTLGKIPLNPYHNYSLICLKYCMTRIRSVPKRTKNCHKMGSGGWEFHNFNKVWIALTYFFIIKVLSLSPDLHFALSWRCKNIDFEARQDPIQEFFTVWFWKFNISDGSWRHPCISRRTYLRVPL